ncbi:MAG TPA: hypothetical protein VM219_09095 [Phycisphaerae bacterium]|nr:hypothetical protein [Phycisphaerae bacterium]HUX02976.1 hypothetical protein [Phycisphaerae bacterium]
MKRSTRFITVLLVLPLAVMAVACGGTPPAAEVVEARKFRLVNEAGGKFEAKPDTTRAMGVDADGLYVRVPAAGSRKGVIFTPDGELGVHTNMLISGIMIDDDGLAILANQDKGIDVDANGVRVKVDAAAAVKVDADGVGLADGTADGQMLVWDQTIDKAWKLVAAPANPATKDYVLMFDHGDGAVKWVEVATFSSP